MIHCVTREFTSREQSELCEHKKRVSDHQIYVWDVDDDAHSLTHTHNKHLQQQQSRNKNKNKIFSIQIRFDAFEL